MDENMDEYNLYWETKMFLEVEELYGWGLESVLAECSSSGLIESQEEGLNSAAAFSSSSKSFSSAKPNTKMIVENRRNLNQRLYSLRSVVPNITKMNKSSILTDAIAYIQELQEQERSLMEETPQLGNMEDPTDHESCQTTNHDKVEYDEDMLRIKDKARCAADNIQVKVSGVGETTLVISITCSKKKDMILKLCQVLPSLNLKIITANIISFSGEIFHTIIIEGDEVDARWLEEKIEMSFAEADKIQPCLLQG